MITTDRSTNCYLSPATILTPSTAQEVSKILSLLRFLGATFSIRGGGHLQNPGFTSNNGGAVISLSKFTQCILSEDKKTVDVGLGLRWLDVYKALDPYDVAVTGGRVPPVGVPGLLLGGGLSFQNSEQGFSCMGVINYEVSLKAFACLKILIQQTNRSFSLMGELLTPMPKKPQIFSGPLKEVARILVGHTSRFGSS
jgi:hypothetical protein